MPFDIDHWKRPRKTIATIYEDNDISYATHGAMVAMDCVKRLGIAGKEASEMHLLDYGCGTGRIARVLTGFFGAVTAYDPVAECIAVGEKECNVPVHNIVYTNVLPVGKLFDVVVSVNVLEHLGLSDQRIMLSRITRLAKPGVPLLIWYELSGNQQSLVEYFGNDGWVEEDESLFGKNSTRRINIRLFKNLTAVK